MLDFCFGIMLCQNEHYCVILSYTLVAQCYGAVDCAFNLDFCLLLNWNMLFCCTFWSCSVIELSIWIFVIGCMVIYYLVAHFGRVVLLSRGLYL